MVNNGDIIIIDYGMGNLRSVFNKFRKIGVSAIISSDPNEIEKAGKLILPGVGHFAAGMKNIQERGLLDILTKKVLTDKTPILGICLGMQLFTCFSEEGNVDGLGWINGETIRFNFNKEEDKKKYKVPHMGWNSLDIKNGNLLYKNIPNNAMFYFVHTYHVVCKDEEDVTACTNYGYEFVSSVHKDNIYGTQFHPEKSHQDGFQIIKNFIAL
ncbi:MAG: imidazole glycerol phosphate synthase subunit HisH [Bacteroidia bacterium]|nr:imidazole glycerol phosphate synthase subunit HisH [Bacteroidia bacterium]